MFGHILAYLLPMAACAMIGAAAGALLGDPLDGSAIGLVIGFFIGVGIYAWRTRDETDGFEGPDLRD